MAGSGVEVARLQVAVLVILVIASASCFQAVRGQDDDGVLSVGDEVQRLPAAHGASNLHRALKSTISRFEDLRHGCRDCHGSMTCCNRRICLDLKTTREHCGSCGHRCDWDRECCNGLCVNTESDRLNCGECGKVCPGNLQCLYGLCGYNEEGRRG